MHLTTHSGISVMFCGCAQLNFDVIISAFDGFLSLEEMRMSSCGAY